MDNMQRDIPSIDNLQVYQNSNIYNFADRNLKSRELNMSQSIHLKSNFFNNRLNENNSNEKFDTQSYSL